VTDKEILKIIRCVVEYSWPWELLGYHTTEDLRLKVKTWKIPEDHSFGDLLFYLYETEDEEVPHVRLDPTHVWNWPIETREGMPVWSRYKIGMFTGMPGDWFPWKHTNLDFVGVRDPEFSQMVAPHPLNPDTPPPSDWSIEGRRVLE